MEAMAAVVMTVVTAAATATAMVVVTATTLGTGMRVATVMGTEVAAAVVMGTAAVLRVILAPSPAQLAGMMTAVLVKVVAVAARTSVEGAMGRVARTLVVRVRAA